MDLDQTSGGDDLFGPPLDVRPLFPQQRSSLRTLLAGLDGAHWTSAVVPAWNVHDMVAHVLHDHARRLSATRDGHHADLPPGSTLPERLNRANDEFVAVAHQLSPRLLIDLIDVLGRDLDALWSTQDLQAPADANVSWASHGATPRWLDLAREYTEYWVHEQQIRDAVGRPGFRTPDVMGPVISTFARALPFTLREIDRPRDTRVRLRVTGPSGGLWEATRGHHGWRMSGSSGGPATTVEIDQDSFWRLAVRGITVDVARQRARVDGDAELHQAVTTLLAIVR